MVWQNCLAQSSPVLSQLMASVGTNLREWHATAQINPPAHQNGTSMKG